MGLQTKTTSYSGYNLNSQSVFVTTYRRNTFTERVKGSVNEHVQDICERYGWEQRAIAVMPDHIHLFVSAPPTPAPNTSATTITSILTVAVFRQVPGVKQRSFWGGGLCSDGCCYGSAGTVSSATIQINIENQKTVQ